MAVSWRDVRRREQERLLELPLEEKLALLASPDWVDQVSAANAIGGPSSSYSEGRPPVAGDPRAVQPLLRAATSPLKNVRLAIAGALSAIATAAASDEPKELIAAALTDPDWRIRYTAARAYTGLAGPGPDGVGSSFGRDDSRRWGAPFGPLVHALADKNEFVRWSAAAGLVAHSGMPRFEGRGESKQPEALVALRMVVDDRTARVRERAIYGYGFLRGTEHARVAHDSSQDEDYRVRLSSLRNLSRHGEVEALVARLRDRTPLVVQQTARWIGWGEHREAAAEVVHLLNHRQHHVRAAAVRALAKLRVEETLEPVLALFERLTVAPLRAEIVSALRTWNDPRAQPILDRFPPRQTPARGHHGTDGDHPTVS